MSRGIDRRRLLALGGAAAAASLMPRPAAGRVALRTGQPVDAGDYPLHEASWYKKIDGGRIQCQLCPNKCEVADQERGSCGGRQNDKGTYYTLVYGRACAVHIDPVEKKPFFHVLPGAQALSYATAGCNVECKFCQNWEISQFRPEQVRAVWLPPKALVAAAENNDVPLVAATYSEPSIFWEYVRDVSQAARHRPVRSLVVSNGYIEKKPLEEVLPLLAAYKVDLKGFREKFYEEQIRGTLKPVLETLATIRASGTWLEIVVLIIPTLNDSEAEVTDLCRWVKANLGPDIPVHFTRFHPTYRLKNLPPTPVPTLDRAWKIGRAEGLHYVYVGNVPGHPGESTYCPKCGTRVIHRVGYEIVANRLKRGRCPNCGLSIPGVWW